jgi:hypothetical protein
MMLRLDGARLTEKSGGGVTVTLIVAVAVMLPEVPVMVNCDVFAGAELAADRVIVLAVVALAPVNDAVRPVGKLLALRTTAPVKPFWGVTLMVAIALPPGPTVTLEADGESLKLGAGVIVIGRLTFCERLPEVAVIVGVAEPTVAVSVAVRVSLLLDVVLDGLNDAVTPFGTPLVLKLTDPVKPF